MIPLSQAFLAHPWKHTAKLYRVQIKKEAGLLSTVYSQREIMQFKLKAQSDYIKALERFIRKENMCEGCAWRSHAQCCLASEIECRNGDCWQLSAEYQADFKPAWKS